MVNHAPTAPPNPARRAGSGYDAIDRWLAERYQLAWLDRSRVRTAVFQGRPVEQPQLTAAAHGLAVQVLAGRFSGLRWSRMLGWADLGLGIGTRCHRDWLAGHEPTAGGVVVPVLGVVNAGLILGAGAWRAVRESRQIRRNAAQALRFNRDAEQCKVQGQELHVSALRPSGPGGVAGCC